MPNFEIPEVDTSPVSKAIIKIIQKEEVTSCDLSAANIHNYLFGRGDLDASTKAYLERLIYNCQNSILAYLGDLEQQICDRTARGIANFDIAFFDTRYSGMLEIHGDTGQLADNLSENDLQRLSASPNYFKMYIEIKANHKLLFDLKRAESIIKKVKPVEANWTDGILEL